MNNKPPKNGFHIEYYPDEPYVQCPGEKWQEGNYKNEKKIGLWTWWYGKKSGGLKSVEENYKDGRLDGLTIHWDTNGKIRKEIYYKNGRQDGKEVTYEDGHKSMEIDYLNGRIEGKCTYFYKNGNKKSEGGVTDTTNDDYPYLKEGKWTYWYETGEKEMEKYFRGLNEKDGSTTTWHKNGQMKSIDPLNGIVLGTVKYWDENGKDITQETNKSANEYLKGLEERRRKRGIKSRNPQRNDTLTGRNVPLTDEEKELGRDFWSGIYGNDEID